MTPPARTTLDDRYGRRPVRRASRRLRLLAGAVLAAVALGVFGWLALRYADPPVSSRLLAWTVVDDTSVSARVAVRVDDGVRATCQLIARAPDHAVVGRRAFEVPGGRARQVVVEQDVATERRATNAELVGCTAPGAPRPR